MMVKTDNGMICSLLKELTRYTEMKINVIYKIVGKRKGTEQCTQIKTYM